MPTYEYRCSNCGNELEEIQSIKAEPLTHCPKCGKETLKRMISGGTSLIFKGSGFYLTDYKNKSVDPGSSTKKDAAPANTKSDTAANTKSSEAAPAKKTETKTETKSETKTDSSKSSSTSKKSS